MAFVIADDKRITQEILIDNADRNGARQGDVVVVELTRRPGRYVKAAGKVVEVLGKEMAPGMEIEIALRNYDLPHTWSAAIEKKLRKISDEVQEEDKVGRVDLRQLPLVTIDGEDARDFDDAVYAERKRSGGCACGWPLLTSAIMCVLNRRWIKKPVPEETLCTSRHR